MHQHIHLEQAAVCTSSADDMLQHVCSQFADGFPNVFIKDAMKVRNRHVAFLASFQSPATIFEQISIIYQLPRLFVGSFTLVLPYFPTGTAERVSPPPPPPPPSPQFIHVLVCSSLVQA